MKKILLILFLIPLLLFLEINNFGLEKLAFDKCSASSFKLDSQVISKSETLKKEDIAKNKFNGLTIKLRYQNYVESVKIRDDYNLTQIRSDILNNGINSRVYSMIFAVNNGFTYEQAVKYSFPEINNIVEKMSEYIEKEPVDATVSVIENSGNIYNLYSKNGVKIDKNTLFKQIFYKLSNFCLDSNFEIPTLIVSPEIKDIEYNKLRGSFKTSFVNSNESRKNNIRTALQRFDGLVLENGQSVSFNKTTGERSEKNGYMKANIIKNGVFMEEYGGGVCQVSTTIYNAALLADLEIEEVHPHSLPVSYIEPCFDAMVNMGSSDLVIKNNSGEKIVFATSSKDDVCLVNIYGLKNLYNIVRKSKKIQDLNEIEEIRTTDYKKYGLEFPPKEKQEIIINNGRKGYKAKGILEYYKDDVLVKTKDNRVNVYGPAKKIILYSEKT